MIDGTKFLEVNAAIHRFFYNKFKFDWY